LAGDCDVEGRGGHGVEVGIGDCGAERTGGLEADGIVADGGDREF
jgi:hypothetical protein